MSNFFSKIRFLRKSVIFLIALNPLKWFSSISNQKLRQKTLKTHITQVRYIAKLAFFNHFSSFFSIFFIENGFESYIEVHKVLLGKKIQSNFFFLVSGPSV